MTAPEAAQELRYAWKDYRGACLAKFGDVLVWVSMSSSDDLLHLFYLWRLEPAPSEPQRGLQALVLSELCLRGIGAKEAA